MVVFFRGGGWGVLFVDVLKSVVVDGGGGGVCVLAIAVFLR